MTEYYFKEHKGCHQIIDIKFPLMKFTMGTLPQGQYSFPFSVVLPDWLPASFEVANEHEKSRMGVRYYLKANFDNTKSSFTTNIVILRPEEQNAEILVDKPHELDEEIGAFCCTSHVKAQIFFQKN